MLFINRKGDNKGKKTIGKTVEQALASIGIQRN